MANIVVCVELGSGQPTESSLSAIADARRVAAAMGATVLALVVPGQLGADGEPGAPPDEEALSAALGATGADKVLLVNAGGGATGWEAPLGLIVDRFAPRLYLLPAGPLADAVGPFLASRTRAFLLPHARLDFRAGSEAVPASVAACRANHPGKAAEGPESVDLAAAALPVVVSLDAHAAPRLTGTRPAELAVLESPRS